MSNWDKELAKIDKQLESISDEALLPTKDAKTPTAKAQVIDQQKRTSTLGAMLRLILVVLLGVAMMFWPYSVRCGFGLFAYIGATGVLVIGGIWSAVWTWRHRTAKAHALSLLVVLWGLILGATEILPRTGYAKPDVNHPAIWTCQ